MFHLTNGKIYVMETPNGTYLPTESSQEAKEFTYKQAKFLQQKSGKKYSWIRNLMMVNTSTGEEKERSNYRGNADAFIGDNDVEFDFSVLEEINAETSAILKTSGWTLDVLSSYEAKLKVGLSKYDRHCLMLNTPCRNMSGRTVKIHLRAKRQNLHIS